MYSVKNLSFLTADYVEMINALRASLDRLEIDQEIYIIIIKMYEIGKNNLVYFNKSVHHAYSHAFGTRAR